MIKLRHIKNRETSRTGAMEVLRLLEELGAEQKRHASEARAAGRRATRPFIVYNTSITCIGNQLNFLWYVDIMIQPRQKKSPETDAFVSLLEHALLLE